MGEVTQNVRVERWHEHDSFNPPCNLRSFIKNFHPFECTSIGKDFGFCSKQPKPQSISPVKWNKCAKQMKTPERETHHHFRCWTLNKRKIKLNLCSRLTLYGARLTWRSASNWNCYFCLSCNYSLLRFLFHTLWHPEFWEYQKVKKSQLSSAYERKRSAERRGVKKSRP